MSWQATLRKATTVDAGAAAQVDDVIRLLEGALTGSVDLPLLRRVLGPACPPDEDTPAPAAHPPIVERLDQAARRGAPGADDETRSALWGTLRELPHVLSRLTICLFGAPLPPPGPESIGAALERLTEPAPPDGTGADRCPRCGYHDFRSTYTGALGRRYYEVHCPRCGLYGAFFEGDPEEKLWFAS